MRESKSRALPLGDTPTYMFSGVPAGIRTPDLRLRRPLLYPTELLAHTKNLKQQAIGKSLNGAGDGNRTHTASLEGWNSTIELHPHIGGPSGARTPDTLIKSQVLYQLS